MQLRLRPRASRSIVSRSFVIKTILISAVFALAIFLLDKIKFPVPKELIKQEISNDKFTTLK